MKRLLVFMKGYKKEAILGPLFKLLEASFELIVPLVMASIIDDGVEKGNMTHIYQVGIVMFIAAALGLIAGLLGGRFGAKASTGFAKNLRERIFNHIQTFSFANIDKFST